MRVSFKRSHENHYKCVLVSVLVSVCECASVCVWCMCYVRELDVATAYVEQSTFINFAQNARSLCHTQANDKRWLCRWMRMWMWMRMLCRYWIHQSLRYFAYHNGMLAGWLSGRMLYRALSDNKLILSCMHRIKSENYVFCGRDKVDQRFGLFS